MKRNIILSSTFILFSILPVLAQESHPTCYEDFLVISNLDSLEKAVYAKCDSPQQYLIGLICLEKSRHALKSEKFGVDLNSIHELATQQKFPLAMATSQYLTGAYEIRNNVSKATPNIIAAIQYFESKNDASAMLICYSLMIAVNKSYNVVNSNNRIDEVRGNMQSIKAYYDKIMVLGKASPSVLDKITRFMTIITYHSLVSKTTDIKREIKALNSAVALVNKNPKYEYIRVVIYTRAISMYQSVGQYNKALKYELMCYKMNNNHQKMVFNNNLGYSYSLIGDYKNAEIYAKKAVEIAKKIKKMM